MAEDWKQKYEAEKAESERSSKEVARLEKDYSNLESRFFDSQNEVRAFTEKAVKAETRADSLLEIVSNLSEALAHEKS